MNGTLKEKRVRTPSGITDEDLLWAIPLVELGQEKRSKVVCACSRYSLYTVIKNAKGTDEGLSR